jgi:hypothetical protein
VNPRLILLVLCLAGNALLATVLIRHVTTPAQPVNSIATKSTVKNQPVLVQPNSDVASATTGMPDFQWSQLAAPDFVIYIVRLRAFGTPETQVRDIIFGAVDAMYRPRRAALRPPKKTDNGKFWERSHRFFYGGDSQMTKEQREQMSALQKEESDLLKSLFGDDFYQQRAKDSGNPMQTDWMEKQYGFIPKELREKVQGIEQKMNEAKQELYAANDGYFDPDSQADLRKVEKKYRDELAKILTPDQLLEWDLRHSDTANQLKNDLSAFDPNEDEFRALFKYKQAQDDLNPPRSSDDDPPQPSAEQGNALAEKRKTLDDELAQAVGTNRVAEYKVEQDYSYRNLIDSGVPKESIFKLDDMKKQAQDAANKIRSDQTLTTEQRTEALSAIRAETQNSMNDLLGEKQAKRYSNNGGWWLNNIAPPVKSP